MKSYKQDVLDAAIEGLVAGGMSNERADLLLVLLDKVYECGYNEALRNTETQESYPYNNRNQLWTVGPQYLGCQVCGLGKNGTATAYVCNRSDCPTRVSCE